MIGGWSLGKLIEFFFGISLTNSGWIILLFGSLIPDSDFIIEWLFKKKVHRTFTHSIFFVFFMFIFGFFILGTIGLGHESLFISLGIISHIGLDMIFKPGVMLLWPYSKWFSFFEITSNIKTKKLTITNLKYKINFLLFDSVLGLIWLSYLYFAGKIILS